MHNTNAVRVLTRCILRMLHIVYVSTSHMASRKLNRTMPVAFQSFVRTFLRLYLDQRYHGHIRLNSFLL